MLTHADEMCMLRKKQSQRLPISNVNLAVRNLQIVQAYWKKNRADVIGSSLSQYRKSSAFSLQTAVLD